MGSPVPLNRRPRIPGGQRNAGHALREMDDRVPVVEARRALQDLDDDVPLRDLDHLAAPPLPARGFDRNPFSEDDMGRPLKKDERPHDARHGGGRAEQEVFEPGDHEPSPAPEEDSRPMVSLAHSSNPSTGRSGADRTSRRRGWLSNPSRTAPRARDALRWSK